MYDIEMMQMLRMIHLENQYIFEILRLGLLCEEERKRLSFDVYDEEYKRIVNSIEKYSTCNECNHKNRFEKMKEIIKERNEKR